MYTLPYNSGASRALQLIERSENERETSLSRIATGLKVASAADNASLWSIATSMRADAATRKTVADGIDTAAFALDVTCKAIETALPLLDRFRQLMLDTASPTADVTAVDKELNAIKGELVTIAKSATFNGTNLLYHKKNASYNFAYVAGTTVNPDGTVSAQTANLDLHGVLLYDEVAGNGWLTRPFTMPGVNSLRQLIASTGNNYVIGVYYTGTTRATGFNYTTAMWSLNEIIKGVTATGAMLGAMKAGLERQAEITRRQADVQLMATNRLVNADLNEESAKTRAIEARHQLAVQSLSIANDKPRRLLQLFR